MNDFADNVLRCYAHLWVPAVTLVAFVVVLCTHGLPAAIAAVLATLLMTAIVLIMTNPVAFVMIIILALFILTFLA